MNGEGAPERYRRGLDLERRRRGSGLGIHRQGGNRPCTSACFVAAVVAALAPARGSRRLFDAGSTFTYSQNMHPLGFAAENTTAPFTANSTSPSGRTAYQGNYDGFRIIDISSPANPRDPRLPGLRSATRATSSSGTTSSSAPGTPRPGRRDPRRRACSRRGLRRLEGLHVFDISDPTTRISSPRRDGVARTRRAAFPISRTAPADLQQPVERSLPRDRHRRGAARRPGRRELPALRAVGACHDTGVILGDAMMAACAGGNGFTVWSLDRPTAACPWILRSSTRRRSPASRRSATPRPSRGTARC